MKKYKNQLIVFSFIIAICAGIFISHLVSSRDLPSKNLVCDKRIGCGLTIPAGVCIPGGTCMQ